MKTTGLTLVIVLAAGCSSSEPAPGSGTPAPTANSSSSSTSSTSSSGSTSGTTTPALIDPNTQYVVETDPAKAQEIVTRMWTVMTGSPCFYMQNSTYNYSFSGFNDYRYSGFETTSGQIGLISSGKFGAYDMAQAQISGTTYWIGVGDPRTLAFTSVHHNGELITNYFIAVAAGQPCV